MKRRKFISFSAIGLLGAAGLKSQESKPTIDSTDNLNSNVEPTPEIIVNNSLERIFPKPLMKGSKVAITAPASPTNMYEIRNAIKTFKSLGCEVIVGKTISNVDRSFRYFSGSEETRVNEFMEFIEREDIDCILCGRGGYGIMRIIDSIDYEKIKINPKIIMGFSDITVLLNSVFNKTGLISFHGPVASSTFNKFTVDSLKKILFSEQHEPNYTMTYKKAMIVNGGQAEGRLVGGNLRMIVSTLGTPFEIDTKNAILFIEEVSEPSYKIDRMLTQLKLSGKLEQCNGFMFGNFKDLKRRKPFHPNSSFTILEVIEQIIKPFGKPTLINMPFGHVKNKITLPIGLMASMDASEKEIVLLENSVQLNS